MNSSTIKVFYPLKDGNLVLRTDQNWDRDLEPVKISKDKSCFEFRLEHDHPYVEFKPCIRLPEQFLWSSGTNKLLISGGRDQRCYPHFYSGNRGQVGEIQELASAMLNRPHRFRVYLPAGYRENPLKAYPVMYMHDGKNLFLAEEAFLGNEWHVDENLDLLDAMNIIDRMIVVGIYADDRFEEYTQPGYELYGKAVVEELVPWVNDHFRTLKGPADTAVLGSSLGGVVAFFLAWEWPEIFGNAACMSSAFAFRDNLLERVLNESTASRRHLKFYLDSGWPDDNYEITLTMAHRLVARGFQMGRNLLYLAFPLNRHNESSWAVRFPLPVQFFAGKLGHHRLGGST